MERRGNERGHLDKKKNIADNIERKTDNENAVIKMEEKKEKKKEGGIDE